MFITLDGIDGGGKSTQIARLADHYRQSGRDVVTVRDPGGTPTGEAIRSLLLDSQLTMNRRSEALLFMAARGELVQRVIRPALDRGCIVISDRFLLANVVYQSTHSANDEPLTANGQLTAQELWQIGRWATGELRPDLTLLLDLPAEVSMTRMDRPADRMESRGLDYLNAVRRGFLDQLPEASPHGVVIDATASPDEVHGSIVAACLRAGIV